MSLASAKKRFEHAREMALRALAGECEADAEAGVFHPIGDRCGFCLHAIEGGCRLRLLAVQAAE